MPEPINTKLLLLSDTHGQRPFPAPITEHIDVAIHCGDLTNESKLTKFQTTLRHLREDLPQTDLKLVIAGNHDFTLDVPAFRNIVANARPPLEPDLVRKTYGDYGEVKGFFSLPTNSKTGYHDDDDDDDDKKIFLLDEEGTYEFQLRNGALLRVYASPFTPSLSGDWGFQYHPNQGHTFDIPDNADVVITHGPPCGVLDYSMNSSSRAGCPDLFRAVASAQPKLHCFGHIHESWGGKLVSWRKTGNAAMMMMMPPSHFTHIDNSRSTVLGNVELLGRARRQEHGDLVYFSADVSRVDGQGQTLFVNAALQGEAGIDQIPWLVNIPLPSAK